MANNFNQSGGKYMINVNFTKLVGFGSLNTSHSIVVIQCKSPTIPLLSPPNNTTLGESFRAKRDSPELNSCESNSDKLQEFSLPELQDSQKFTNSYLRVKFLFAGKIHSAI